MCINRRETYPEAVVFVADVEEVTTAEAAPGDTEVVEVAVVAGGATTVPLLRLTPSKNEVTVDKLVEVGAAFVAVEAKPLTNAGPPFDLDVAPIKFNKYDKLGTPYLNLFVQNRNGTLVISHQLGGLT